MVKNPLAVQETEETWVRFLGGEDPLEEGMATHSTILAWRIPCTEEPGGLQSMALLIVRHDLALFFLIYHIALSEFFSLISQKALWSWRLFRAPNDPQRVSLSAQDSGKDVRHSALP